MQVSAWLWQKLMPARRRLRGKRPAGEPVVLQDPSDGGLLDGAEGPDAAGGVKPPHPHISAVSCCWQERELLQH